MPWGKGLTFVFEGKKNTYGYLPADAIKRLANDELHEKLPCKLEYDTSIPK